MPARALSLALTAGHVAYAVAETRASCPHVELWRTESRTRIRFATTLPACKDVPSTGLGIPSVAVARDRVLWVSYTGGNKRDWQLWTATATRRQPRQLRAVERDVEAPAPIVLGPGTVDGVPYAVDSDVVLLGENGRAVFRATVASPVRAIAAGVGPGRARVAALLANGVVVGLDRQGRAVSSLDAGPSATAVRISPLGIAVQAGSEVSIGAATAVRLPAAAELEDVAQGRLLWTRAGDLGSTSIVTGRSSRLVNGARALPVLGQLEQRGLAWSKGRSVVWRAGTLP